MCVVCFLLLYINNIIEREIGKQPNTFIWTCNHFQKLSMLKHFYWIDTYGTADLYADHCWIIAQIVFVL